MSGEAAEAAPVADPRAALKAAVMADPAAVLEDADLVRALLAAHPAEAPAGARKVVDLRGALLDRRRPRPAKVVRSPHGRAAPRPNFQRLWDFTGRRSRLLCRRRDGPAFSGSVDGRRRPSSSASMDVLSSWMERGGHGPNWTAPIGWSDVTVSA